MKGKEMNNVLEWLEATAQRVPDNIAFADVNSQLTFAELAQRAQRAGGWLAGRIEPCQPVAFFLEKSTAAMASMLGAVYARGHYCVLDVRQPAPRLTQIARTLSPALVLTDAVNEDQAREVFEPLGLAVHLIDEAIDYQLGEDDRKQLDLLRSQAETTDPVYVNFTSGSTGTPKGVVVAHRSIIDFIGHFTEIFGITEDDRIANQAPFDFDVSVKDIYSGLSTGASVHLVPREYFSIPVQLMDFLCERRVTICTWAVSALCFVTTMGGLEYRTPETIRRVIFSGEVMPAKHLAKWRTALPDAMFVNVYGPTEVTCNCTYYIIGDDMQADAPIPIGKPFPNETVLLVEWGQDGVGAAGAGAAGAADSDADSGAGASGAAGAADTGVGAAGATDVDAADSDADSVADAGAGSGAGAQDRQAPRIVGADEVGVEGEICVGGDCLALGYCNEPERTAKAFVSNPFAAEPAILYRTGDLAFYNDEGELVYSGRADHQIKHLGQRIELGEIDAAAQSVEGVDRACCLYDHRKKRIHLFFSGACDKATLSETLKEKLPSYMTPNKIHPIEVMPLNKNGKIDRAALEAQAGISR